MPINKEKGAAYLRYRRALVNITYAKITDETSIPTATLSNYFNGTVQNPNKETYEKLMACVGGTWEEYDDWKPETNDSSNSKPLGLDIESVARILSDIRSSYDTMYERAEKAHAAQVAQLEKDVRAHRLEKWIFVVLLAVTVVILILK